MRDSKPQRFVRQHESLKVTRNATNQDKHVNEASKQMLVNISFKRSCKNTQIMFYNWNICFNVIKVQIYEKSLCNMSKIGKEVMTMNCAF